MTDREYSDRDLDRLYERTYATSKRLDEQVKLLDTQVTELARLQNRVSGNLINQQAINEFDKQDIDHALGFVRNIVSNLYGDPFPPATEDEWDEAHEIEAIRRWYEMNMMGTAGFDDFMGIFFGFTRDEADCECTCCQQRKGTV